MIERTIDRATRAQMHRLLDDCIDFTNLGHAFFFEFAGHTGGLNIYGYEGDYDRDKPKLYRSQTYTDATGAAIATEAIADGVEGILDEKSPLLLL